MSCLLLSAQVGLIQLEQEQVFIQPVNNSGGPFSGREHLIRRRWSSTPSPSTEVEGPRQHCKVVTGESREQRCWNGAPAQLTLCGSHRIEVISKDMPSLHSHVSHNGRAAVILTRILLAGWISFLCEHHRVMGLD